jgi:hypothetical protein
LRIGERSSAIAYGDSMPYLLQRVVRTGLIAGVVSAAAAAALSRLQNGRGASAINAVSHIAWGGRPPAHAGKGGRNFFVGAGLHIGASMFWATLFEGLFGRSARQRAKPAWLGGGATAALAYLTDYRVVPRRLRPGMEAFLPRWALYGVYAALGAGFALAARRRRAVERRSAGVEEKTTPPSQDRQPVRGGEIRMRPDEASSIRPA